MLNPLSYHMKSSGPSVVLYKDPGTSGHGATVLIGSIHSQFIFICCGRSIDDEAQALLNLYVEDDFKQQLELVTRKNNKDYDGISAQLAKLKMLCVTTHSIVKQEKPN